MYGEKKGSLLTPNQEVDDLEFLTSLEREIISELNRARQNPKKYADSLEEYKKHYVGKYIYIANREQTVTQEGVAAVNEAIDFLRRTDTVPLLRVSRGLSLAAALHVEDQGPKGLIGHQGSDNSTPEERINRFGTWKGAYGENIEYGNFTAREIIMQLIIDDGVPNRAHRLNIFKPFFGVVGVSFGSHQAYTYMCVIDFAGAYEEGNID